MSIFNRLFGNNEPYAVKQKGVESQLVEPVDINKNAYALYHSFLDRVYNEVLLKTLRQVSFESHLESYKDSIKKIDDFLSKIKLSGNDKVIQDKLVSNFMEEIVKKVVDLKYFFKCNTLDFSVFMGLSDYRNMFLIKEIYLYELMNANNVNEKVVFFSNKGLESKTPNGFLLSFKKMRIYNNHEDIIKGINIYECFTGLTQSYRQMVNLADLNRVVIVKRDKIDVEVLSNPNLREYNNSVLSKETNDIKKALNNDSRVVGRNDVVASGSDIGQLSIDNKIESDVLDNFMSQLSMHTGYTKQFISSEQLQGFGSTGVNEIRRDESLNNQKTQKFINQLLTIGVANARQPTVADRTNEQPTSDTSSQPTT